MAGDEACVHFPSLATGFTRPCRELGFEGLFAANSNFDLRGLGFGPLGEVDLQYALVTVGAHLSRIHGAGKRDRAGKASALPFDGTEVLLFLFLFDLALALDG
jgi:hypothetical protein